MPQIPDSTFETQNFLPQGQVTLELQFSGQTILTTEELASLIDGLQACHDLVVEAAGRVPEPVWIETVRHPNSVVVLASAFLVANKATFAACATWIGTLAVPYLQLRKATRELQKAKIESEKDTSRSAPHVPAPVQPPNTLREALKEAIAVVSQLDGLSPQQRGSVMQATLLAKLSPADREQIQSALRTFGIEKIEATTGIEKTEAASTPRSATKRSGYPPAV